MLISTRGRYALRVLVDLAQQEGRSAPLRSVAQRQGISLKYLETIMPLLVREGLVSGSHGKGGGYTLALPPEKCSVGRVLRLTEGTLAPVACLGPDAQPCPRQALCPTLPMWTRLDGLIEGYLDSVTLADLLSGQAPQKEC